MKSRITSTIVCLIIPIAANDVAAHGSDCNLKCGTRDNHVALKSELMAWAHKEVLPTVQTWKNTFDASMDRTDLAQLNELRARTTQVRKEAAELATEWRAAVRKVEVDEDAIAAINDRRNAIRENLSDIMMELRPLAVKYKESLKKLEQEAKPQISLWIARLASRVENSDAVKAVPRERLPHILRHWLYRLPMSNFSGIRARAAAAFMLWDGRAFNEIGNESGLMSTIDSEADGSGITLSQNSPNPVSRARTSIAFSLPHPVHVRMVLVDMQGNQVCVICDTDYPAGDHQVEFDASHVANGKYIYRMNAGGVVLSKSMSIVR